MCQMSDYASEFGIINNEKLEVVVNITTALIDELNKLILTTD